MKICLFLYFNVLTKKSEFKLGFFFPLLFFTEASFCRFPNSLWTCVIQPIAYKGAYGSGADKRVMQSSPSHFFNYV